MGDPMVAFIEAYTKPGVRVTSTGTSSITSDTTSYSTGSCITIGGWTIGPSGHGSPMGNPYWEQDIRLELLDEKIAKILEFVEICEHG